MTKMNVFACTAMLLAGFIAGCGDSDDSGVDVEADIGADSGNDSSDTADGDDGSDAADSSDTADSADAVTGFTCNGVAPEDLPTPTTCNGHAELCSRRFNEVAFAQTHNAMSNADEGWVPPNQTHNIEQQLRDGIESMLLDTHEDGGAISLCHSFCDLGRRDLVDGLTAIREHLDCNPGEVFSIFFESYISDEQTAAAMSESGLLAYAHEQATDEEWPTLGEMIESGKRLVVFTQSGGSYPWYHLTWDYVWDTGYSWETVEDFDCARGRGSTSHPLFAINHWLSTPLSSPANAEEANTEEVLGGRVARCKEETGQLPNFIAVDFYDIGVLFETVDELNGFAGETAGD